MLSELTAAIAERPEVTSKAPDWLNLPEPRGFRPKKRYRSVWISDVHLGTRGCKAAMLVDFLRSTEAEQLYLVGDIIDGWSPRERAPSRSCRRTGPRS